MAQRHTGPIATEIQLHQRSHILELSFDDGAHFELSCEYLRVHSPAAEVRTLQEQGKVLTGKERVNISRISPVGQYAVQLVFDDGHDTGVYSWETLYELGRDYEANWQAYLDALAQRGYERKETEDEQSGPKKVTVLYFATLATQLGRESEELSLPASVSTTGELITWLGKRSAQWQQSLTRSPLKVTVNKQFAADNSRLHDGDEIAIVATQSA